ncbi:hypothetical protein [[Eubacterium] cellulosolvens]
MQNYFAFIATIAAAANPQPRPINKPAGILFTRNPIPKPMSTPAPISSPAGSYFFAIQTI